MDWPCPQAVTQELMLYWLQQLQMKRWCHRRTAIGPHSPDGDPAGEDQSEPSPEELRDSLVLHGLNWFHLLVQVVNSELQVSKGSSTLRVYSE